MGVGELAHYLRVRRRRCDKRESRGLPLMKSKRDPRRRPTHPGEVLREDVLPALSMSQTEFAKRLGVSRLSVSELLLGKRALSADMAVRVGKFTINSLATSSRRPHAAHLSR